ncbi:nucleolar transcription factor 1-like [Etheostoma cragini]|uniref:nucleolar transcription factor 1-like n=1 Tax=Etheostoma cragini TaxID=417921 RepID=UPI00155E75AD|nr:nucleolar transcription factor 1-like [Etheostoma cragini]
MSGTETVTGGSEWTKANLQKLLAAMKTSIPEHDLMSAYAKGLKSVDWNVVAFPPFSAEACQEKWREILQKMRKTRTLTELIVEAEDVISNPVKNMKMHPELPKRPCPPNAVFYEENWAKFHKKHPNMSRRKGFKCLINKYKALSDEEKAQYVEKSELAMRGYKKKMRQFRKQYEIPPRRKPKAGQKKRKKLSADTPNQREENTKVAKDLPSKPPFNGYNLFCKEQRASMTGFSGNTYVSVWAQRWRDLTPRQRDEYSNRCRELKRQYSVMLNKYLMTFDKEEQQRILNENGIKRPREHKSVVRKVVRKLPGEPKMPSRSGNVIFCKNQMEVMKEKLPNANERFTKVNQMWHALSDREKQRYKEEVCKNVNKYATELQKWFKTLPAADQEAYRIRNPSKLQFLNVNQMKDDREELSGAVYRPSDSEDEDIEDSSSDEEEEDNSDCYEVEEEEDDDDVIMFKVF